VANTIAFGSVSPDPGVPAAADASPNQRVNWATQVGARLEADSSPIV
jgi:hypothetical protein